MMRRFASASVLFVLVCTATAQPPDAKKTDRELIQGNWWILGLESGGKSQSDKGFKGNSFTFKKIKGVDTATLYERAYPPVEFTYSIDATKNPKEINFSAKGIRSLGIYKLDGDELTICVSLGGSRPGDFTTRMGGDTEIFTLKRNRWEPFFEKGAFSIDFPGRPTESKKEIDGATGKTTARILTVRSEMDRITYTVTITALPGKLMGAEAQAALESAQKGLLAELDQDGNPTVESEVEIPAPAGVAAAREATISLRPAQSRDRGMMRVRFYALGERIISLAASGSDEVARSPNVVRFWNSFRSPIDRRKEFPRQW